MTTKVTGKVGHRIHTRLFRKPLLVLQVEVRGFVAEYSTPSIEGEYESWWVDATPNLLEAAREVTD